MKTTSKLQLAFLVMIGLTMSFQIWQPDPDSPATLIGLCVLLGAAYFFFRYNKQIKQQMDSGSIPKPTIEAKRRHFWALTAGLTLGALTGSFTFVFSLQPILGLSYSLLTLIPFDLFIAYLIYWLWRKFYRVQ